MAKYTFGKIEIAVSKINTPQDWLAMKLIERHANDLFYEHYLAIEENEKKLKKGKYKAVEDQVKIDKHLAHMWWMHNVRNKVVDSPEYTQWIADLLKELPEKLKKNVDMKEWFLIASSIVSEYGPKLVNIKEELVKLKDEADNNLDND